jgi:hypothetical protein
LLLTALCSAPASFIGTGKSSLVGGSEYDAESQGSLEHGSRASGGRRGQRDVEEEIEVDPFEAAVELLYEKRYACVEQAQGIQMRVDTSDEQQVTALWLV